MEPGQTRGSLAVVQLSGGKFDFVLEALYEKPKVTRFMHVKRENNSGKP
jgi:hypothetical protein